MRLGKSAVRDSRNGPDSENETPDGTRRGAADISGQVRHEGPRNGDRLGDAVGGAAAAAARVPPLGVRTCAYVRRSESVLAGPAQGVLSNVHVMLAVDQFSPLPV